ncbi:MAG TPA: hypothetical protein VHD63_07340 [Ktedonobacteraceae bacterium]|nr:hypothetical protein [Ktedonobacteraceae bacterium]
MSAMSRDRTMPGVPAISLQTACIACIVRKNTEVLGCFVSQPTTAYNLLEAIESSRAEQKEKGQREKGEAIITAGDVPLVASGKTFWQAFPALFQRTATSRTVPRLMP